MQILRNILSFEMKGNTGRLCVEVWKYYYDDMVKYVAMMERGSRAISYAMLTINIYAYIKYIISWYDARIIEAVFSLHIAPAPVLHSF